MLHSSSFAAHTAKIVAAVSDESRPTALVSSWRRCATIHGLKPDGVIRPERRENYAVTEARQKNEDLVRAAAEPMEHLLRDLPGSDHMLFLTDDRGTVVETMTRRMEDFWDRPRREWVGTDFSEAAAGTNGVGTVLRERRAMTIAGEQHYHASNVVAICCGAPLYDDEGGVRGCIDITFSAKENDPLTNYLTLAAAMEAARKIELRLFANNHPGAKLVLANQSAPNASALFAVDRHGAVVGATRAARATLKLTSDQVRGGFSAEQLWGVDELSDLSRTAVEKRAIEAALVRHGGNISAAAKAVGISRSTFYRKVSDYRCAMPVKAN